MSGRRFEFRRGTNVSHWLSQSERRGTERRAAFTREDVLRVRELGLDHLRLPVDEEQLWREDGGREEEAFALLLEGLGWCRDAGLAAVVDLHILRSHHFLDDAPALFADEREVERFADLWRDLSDALAGQPLDAVAYEVLNEPVAADDEEWNGVAAVALAAIREREPERTVVLGGNRFSNYAHIGALRVPEDPNVVITFHYYEPALLTHYRAWWMPEIARYDGRIRYPGSPVPDDELRRLPADLRAVLAPGNEPYDRSRIEADVSLPLEVAAERGHRLYCGELGVLATVPDETRLRWYRDVLAVLDEREIAWANWDLRGGFGIFAGTEPTVVHRALAERRYADAPE